MELASARRRGALLVLALILAPLLGQTTQKQTHEGAEGKPQVLLTEGDGWQTDAESKTPQTQKDFSQRCPEFLFTVKEEKPADFFLLLDHTVESGDAPVRYKFELIDKNGRVLATAPAGGLDDAIKGACEVLREVMGADVKK